MDGELIAGKFENDTIEIVKGIGDQWTLSHEAEHMCEKAGLITPKEIAVLKMRIKLLVRAGKFETQNENDIGGQEIERYLLRKNYRAEPSKRERFKGF